MDYTDDYSTPDGQELTTMIVFEITALIPLIDLAV